MTEISLQEYCKQIEDTIEQGRYAEAVAHGKHILEKYPKHVATYQLLGKTMLESGQNDEAADMFRRVLSADPEDLVSWIGMSELYTQRGELDAAALHLERAFEQASDNEVIEEELRKLYSKRDGIEYKKVQLTRGALARFYLKADLLPRAISELRDLLDKDPERADLSVALAEALWRNEQRLEASEVCQKLLDTHPDCIKANLILGEIWGSSGREEGEIYLRRAKALDPENQIAQALFGPVSPLQARKAYIDPLTPAAMEELPTWMEAPGTAPSGALADSSAAMEVQIEMPTWLEDAVGDGLVAPPAADIAGQPPAEQPVEEMPPAPMEAVPDWLSQAGLEPGGGEEIPEWSVAPAGIAEEPTIAEMDEDIPDWLTGLGGERDEKAPPPAPSEELPADWLAGIRDQFTEETPEDIFTAFAAEETSTPEWMRDEEWPPAEEPDSTVPAPSEIPDWMQELAPPEPAAAIPTAPAVEETPTPDWMTSEAVPSGDDALAWLEQLAAGKAKPSTKRWLTKYKIP